MKDANGREIKIGDKVRHLFAPCRDELPGPGDDPASWHYFFGVSPVLAFIGEHCVEVRKTHKIHIPVHLSDLVVVHKEAA